MITLHHCSVQSYKLTHSCLLKLKFRKYPAIHTNYIISHSTTLQYNHNIWHGTKAEKKYWTRKIMISIGLPYLQFSINREGFSRSILIWPAYGDGRKRENSSAWKHRIIVASTCRRSEEFGRYVTWLWRANCVSVVQKMLSSLKWCSLNNCNWCVSLDISYILALNYYYPITKLIMSLT